MIQLQWHRTRLTLLALATFALVLNGMPSASAAARERRSLPCATKGARALLATRHARVIEKRHRVYACLYPRGRRFLLGTRRGDNYDARRVTNLRLTGRFVGYVRRRASGLRVTSRELRRGRIVRDARAAVASRVGFQAVTDLTLKPNGSVAWIVRTVPIDVPLNLYRFPGDTLPDYEVGKSDRAGPGLLDRGHDITAGSLTLTGSIASWTKAGSGYSAVLY
ncbi:MAG: hypothetical protein M3301_05090 [Chloroflexota bacterium]|nr:hypothetical protein [Chloroflexota bacterium]